MTRALGATPDEVAAGLSMAPIAPALVGALLGIAGGYGLFSVASHGASITMPPAWWLAAAVAGTLVAVTGLTSVPARFGARLPIAEVLQTEGA